MSNDLTVVIPAFNATNTLERTLRSVVQDKSDNIAVVVVIDGPDDGMSGVAEAFPNTAVIFNQGVRGASHARNAGLAECETEFVTFLDADDFIEGPLHVSMVQSLRSTDSDVVFSSWRWQNVSGEEVYGRLDIGDLEPLVRSVDDFVAVWAAGGVSKTGAMAWRTSALRGIGGWNASFRRYQDAEIGLRSIISNLSYCFARDGLLIYVDHNNSQRVSRVPVHIAAPSMRRYLEMLDKFASSSTLSDRIRAEISRKYYSFARYAYQNFEDAIGDEFLRGARMLGLLGHPGSAFHSSASHLFGLKRKSQMSRWAHDLVWNLRGRNDKR